MDFEFTAQSINNEEMMQYISKWLPSTECATENAIAKQSPPCNKHSVFTMTLKSRPH